MAGQKFVPRKLSKAQSRRARSRWDSLTDEEKREATRPAREARARKRELAKRQLSWTEKIRADIAEADRMHAEVMKAEVERQVAEAKIRYARLAEEAKTLPGPREWFGRKRGV